MPSFASPSRLILALIAAGATTTFVAPLLATSNSANVFATQEDPTAEQIMAASVKGLGGREAIFKIKSLHTVMTMSAQGAELQLESFWSREGGRMSKTVLPQGEVLMASDGKVGWMKSPTGYVLLDEKQTEDLNNQAGMFMNMLDPQKALAERQGTAANAGKETFADKECWRVHIKRGDGKESDMFFEVATSMPVGGVSAEKKGDVETKSKMLLGDWQEVQGVKFFHSMRIETIGQQTTAIEMKVTKVEINTLDAATFAMPEEVRKLADARPAATAPAAAPAKVITLESMTPEQQKNAKEALDGMLKSGDVEKMKMMVKQLEPMLGMIPANERVSIEYAIQEVKKEIAKLGG